MKVVTTKQLADTNRVVEYVKYKNIDELISILQKHHNQTRDYKEQIMIVDADGEQRDDVEFIESCTAAWEEILHQDKTVILFSEYQCIKHDYKHFNEWINE